MKGKTGDFIVYFMAALTDKLKKHSMATANQATWPVALQQSLDGYNTDKAKGDPTLQAFNHFLQPFISRLEKTGDLVSAASAVELPASLRVDNEVVTAVEKQDFDVGSSCGILSLAYLLQGLGVAEPSEDEWETL